MKNIVAIVDWIMNFIAVGVFGYFWLTKDYENAKTAGIILIMFLITTLVRIVVEARRKR